MAESKSESKSESTFYVIRNPSPSLSITARSEGKVITLSSKPNPLVYAVNRGVKGERGLPGIADTITNRQIDLLF